MRGGVHLPLEAIGADFMGAIEAIAPTDKKLWGRCPKSHHRNFAMLVFFLKR